MLILPGKVVKNVGTVRNNSIIHSQLRYIFASIMLNKEEKAFIEYWEANRDRQKRFSNQWMIGLPAGLVFGLPVLLNVFADWNTQIKFMTRGQLNVLLVAVMIIISFYSVFNIRHKWDLREQHYRELKAKEKAQQADAVSSPPLNTGSSH
jgi:hypothetical protein